MDKTIEELADSLPNPERVELFETLGLGGNRDGKL
jgi:hypothetical protein